jgi:hypothetical protein
MRARTKATESEHVICVQSFAADDVPPPGVVKRLTRLRGDHPIVRAHPGYFASADLGDNELPNEHHFVPDPEQHESDVRILERLPDNQLMEAVCDLSIGVGGGDTIRKARSFGKIEWRFAVRSTGSAL